MWFRELGRWAPHVSREECAQKYQAHAQRDALTLMLVAFENSKPVGMAFLRITDGVRLHRSPWLGGLVVEPQARGRGIAQQLISAIQQEARRFHYKEIFLLTFNVTLPEYCQRMGWETVDHDVLFGNPVTVMGL